MSDARIRELERRWRESGSEEDRAAWLGERLRAGAIEPGRVELAAWVGDEAARWALGQPPVPPPESPWAPAGTHALSHTLAPLEAWARGLRPWAALPHGTAAQVAPEWRHQVPARAVLALARRAYGDEPPNRSGANALEAADEWLRQPGPASVERVARVNKDEPIARESPREALARYALLCCGPLEQNRIVGILYLRVLTGCGLKEGKDEVDRADGAPGLAARGAAKLVGEQAVRVALKDALAPWALGERDPLDP